MKKNKILFLVFAVAMMVFTIGCTTKPMRPLNTQTRVGQNGLGNDVARQRNNNIMGIDRRNMDNLSGMGPNTTNDFIGRNNVVEPNTTDNLARRNNVVGPNTTNDMVRNNDTTDFNKITARANTIAQRVANLNEVNNCSVLLSGNSCIVGVDMKNNIQGNMTTAVKQKIERTVKNTDNNIKNVSITADPDLFTRISTLATDIGNGRPITGFANQFQEILRRITPIK